MTAPVFEVIFSAPDPACGHETSWRSSMWWDSQRAAWFTACDVTAHECVTRPSTVPSERRNRFPGGPVQPEPIPGPHRAANGEVMSENLRDLYAEVMDKHRPVQSARLVVDCLCGWMADKRRPDHFAEHLRDELLAARDDVLAAHQEQIETYYRASQEWLRIEAEQKAEIERWRGEYGKQHDRADRIQSNTAALYGRAHDAEARAHIAEAEVARLRETVDRVEAALMQGGQTAFIRWRDAVAALVPRESATEAPRTRDSEVVDGYLCRHGKYAYEHDCDDHRDRAAGKGLCTCGTCLAIADVLDGAS